MQLRLESGPMVNCAGILRWAINGYKFPKDRPNLRRVIREGWAHPLLTNKVVDKLLSGNLPYTLDGDNVIIELP